MSIDFAQVGKRVKEFRRKKGLSQASLAHEVNVTPPYISIVERAAKIPSLPTFLNIAKVLGVTANDLLFGGDASISSEVEELLFDCDSHERRLIFETVCMIRKLIRAK